jgi:hypothetical protein
LTIYIAAWVTVVQAVWMEEATSRKLMTPSKFFGTAFDPNDWPNSFIRHIGAHLY